MTQFDAFIYKVYSEDLSSQGPAVKPGGGQPDMPSTSSASASTGGIKPSLGAATTPTSAPAQNQNAAGPDYISLLSDPKSFEAFSQNPEQVQNFKTYLSDHNNLQDLTSRIKDPNVMNSVIGLLTQPQR